jgi:3-hydroxyacyl-CoA dehydrogenase
MSKNIKKVAVLGAGVMGSQIAAHLTNAGYPVLLYDMTAELAQKGLDYALKIKPMAFYNPKTASSITLCNYEDDIEKIAEADWVVEAIAEKLEWKKDLYNKIAPHLQSDAIISSNTSGIAIQLLVEGMPQSFRENFVITHFFNPPRYLRLLELIPGEETKPEVVDTISEFVTEILGKGIVLAKDTPNFIGNRIGVYGMMKTIELTQKYKLTVEEVDKLTGTIIGRPKSATYRTADVVGLDTFAHVAATSYNNLPDDEEREIFNTPDFLKTMLDKGMLGQKTKQGFYKKVNKDILSLNFETLEYQPQKKVRFDSYRAAKGHGTLGNKVRALVYHDDLGGRFLWDVMISTLTYALNRIPEIADTVYDIDNAMKWGYGWEIGVFEIWDAIGLEKSYNKMRDENRPVPAKLKAMLEAGHDSFYKFADGKEWYYDFTKNDYAEMPVDAKEISPRRLRKSNGVVEKNWCASIVDIGDGVAQLQFHSILQPEFNPIDASILEMLMMAPEIVKHFGFRGLVIGHEGAHFSAGANLHMILALIKLKAWKRIEEVAFMLQDAVQKLRYAPFPVVMSPKGVAVGGGYEVQGAGDIRVASAELYTGLVEVGVGVVPAGGGCLRMLLNNEERLAPTRSGPFPIAREAFETIAFAKVSFSAMEAVKYKYLRKADRIVINPARLFFEAKKAVLELAENYEAPAKREDIILPGPDGRLVMEAQIRDFVKNGTISEHDALIGRWLAKILTGGDNASLFNPVTEDDILALEREAFVELCKTEKTQARIDHMLKTGKPLRN